MEYAKDKTLYEGSGLLDFIQESPKISEANKKWIEPIFLLNEIMILFMEENGKETFMLFVNSNKKNSRFFEN
jgi:hypothetical protein